MDRHVVCVGLSHLTAPVELREQLALDQAASTQVALSLLSEDGVAETFVLSTCNRTELYAYADDPQAVRSLTLREFAGWAPLALLEPCLYAHCGKEAITHLFRVAASLDSQVVGEAQILAQLKAAHQLAGREGTIGAVLDGLLRRALETGKRVRTQTTIGKRPVSISSAAVELAERAVGSLDGCVALILGAGETSELTAAHLKAHGVEEILIANRTYDASVLLAGRCGGRAVPWGELGEHLEAADIVVSSTAAPHCVITRDEVQRIMPGRGPRPLFLVDIAVPRDCEPEIGAIDGVHLYDIDDLTGAVEQNRAERELGAQAAARIVAEEVEKAQARLACLEVVPTIVALRAEIERLRLQELARTRRRLGAIDECLLREIEVFGKRLANKILHLPATRLKELSSQGDGYPYLEALRWIFALDESADEAHGSSAARGQRHDAEGEDRPGRRR